LQREKPFTRTLAGPIIPLVASNSEGLWNGPETAIALNVARPTINLLVPFVVHRRFLGMLAAAINYGYGSCRGSSICAWKAGNERTRIARICTIRLLQVFMIVAAVSDGI